MAMILPGSCIGILGGGQLGRMLAQAAQTLGYRVHVYEPQADCPAGAVANREVNAPYTDTEALREFVRNCDVVTYEFENIPAEPLRKIESENLTQLYPHWRVLEVCQNRLREKTWLKNNGIPHARFCAVAVDGDVAAAISEVGLPCVVKTADFGYDGKGQLKVKDEDGVKEAVKQFAGQRAVVERFINFQCELSVVVARSSNGECRTFPVAENIHTNHILDFSIVPARVAVGICEQAESIGQDIANKLDVVGLVAVELFLTTEGELLVNELAPRPHNSGHYTLDSCWVSQFEQHVRAVCGLPLGDPAQRSPAVMVNILGDSWFESDGKTRRLPHWPAVLKHAGAKLHLYGKAEARVGRKMGHFTVSAGAVDTALAQAQDLKALL
jgi:5-(carboxyamino)imidazole ribonucleotide synthase